MSDHLKPTITLTGATGFLGSHLMDSLLKSGHRLMIPGRSNKEDSLEVRIHKLLKWFGTKYDASQLEILEVDYLKPSLGLSSEEYNRICALTDEVIHCASETCFSEFQRIKVIQFNVQQLSGILDFASAAAVTSFTYISTAYAAGIREGICKEELSTAKKFHNVYEESKAQAEKIIWDQCKTHAIPLKIIRPTIVYGNSSTGRTLKFNAFYYPIRSLHTVQNIYLNDIKNQGGKRSARQGIYLGEDSRLFLPLKIYLPKKGKINLIPVDYFVKATLKIIEHRNCEGIYHLSSKIGSAFDQLADFTMDFLRIKGLQVIYEKPGEPVLQNPAEELFDRFIEPYRPYLADDRIFEKKQSDRLLGNIQAPEMSGQIFLNCMNYAVEAEWGEKIFKEEMDYEKNI